MIKLIVHHRVSWGNHRYYPINDTALKLLELINTTERRRCFTSKEIAVIRQIGFDVEIEPARVKVEEGL